jgi:hypothetical protein
MKTTNKVLLAFLIAIFCGFTTPLIAQDADPLKCGGDPIAQDIEIQLVKVTVADETNAKERAAVNEHIRQSIENNPASYGIESTCAECQTPDQTGCDLTIGGVEVEMEFDGHPERGKSSYIVKDQTITVQVSCSICESDATKEVSIIVEGTGDLNSTSGISSTSELRHQTAALSYYPNPSEGNITVSFPVKKSDQYRLIFRDLQGRELLEKELGNLEEGIYKNNFSLDELSTGMYMMSLESSDQRSTVRLVIQ